MADEARPPFVRFEVRAIEDREATVEQGHYVAKDVVFALVTPVGSKDTVEKVADDWLANIQEGVKQERIPDFWYTAYKRALDEFRQGREVPVDGTPITDCAIFSPAQTRLLQDINVLTVENMAEANEETVQRIGMGGRALKQRAQAWLDSSDKGKSAGQLDKLRQENKELKERDKEREAQLAKLSAQVEALTKKEDA